MAADFRPELSVVVVLAGDTLGQWCETGDLEITLGALMQQVNPPVMEVIVPCHSQVKGLKALTRRFRRVGFPYAGCLRSWATEGREHHDELRAHGARIARGDIIAFLEDHVRPDPFWSRGVIEAHSKPYAGIGGAIENAVNRPLNWASYFCDLGRYQNPVPVGESASVSTVNVSYKRRALESIKPMWAQRFNETRVNWALVQQGEKLALSPDIVVYQFRMQLRLNRALREFLIWGRSYARARSQSLGAARRIMHAVLAPVLPGLLLLRVVISVLRKRRSYRALATALPFIPLLTFSWAVGEFLGYLPHKSAAREGRLDSLRNSWSEGQTFGSMFSEPSRRRP